MKSCFNSLRRTLLSTPALMFTTGFASTTAAAKPVSNAQTGDITIGRKFSLTSRVLGEPRAWRLASLPAKNAGSDALTVFYVLDAERLFEGAVAAVRFYAGIKTEMIGNAVVVGIDNGKNRTDDLTPKPSAIGRSGKAEPGAKPTGGKSSEFFRFIVEELEPEIAEHIDTSKVVRRVLIGHSFAGLFALSTLAVRPVLFDDCIALDPSLWWDAGSVLDDWNASSQKLDFTGKRLYVAFAATPRTANQVHLKRAEEFKSRMLAHWQRNGLVSHVKSFPDENHGSVVLPGIADALKTLYSKPL